MPLGGYRGGTGKSSSQHKAVENIWVFSLDLKVERERESQFNRAGGSEFQIKGVAVLNDQVFHIRIVSNSIWETDGRTDCPSVRLLDGVWHIAIARDFYVKPIVNSLLVYTHEMEWRSLNWA